METARLDRLLWLPQDSIELKFLSIGRTLLSRMSQLRNPWYFFLRIISILNMMYGARERYPCLMTRLTHCSP